MRGAPCANAGRTEATRNESEASDGGAARSAVVDGGETKTRRGEARARERSKEARGAQGSELAEDEEGGQPKRREDWEAEQIGGGVGSGAGRASASGTEHDPPPPAPGGRGWEETRENRYDSTSARSCRVATVSIARSTVWAASTSCIVLSTRSTMRARVASQESTGSGVPLLSAITRVARTLW